MEGFPISRKYSGQAGCTGTNTGTGESEQSNSVPVYDERDEGERELVE